MPVLSSRIGLLALCAAAIACSPQEQEGLKRMRSIGPRLAPTQVDDGYSFDGPTFETRLTQRGVQVAEISWQSSLTLGSPVATDDRVEYRGADGSVEWYEATEQGLEQGFTLATRPEGDLTLLGTVDGINGAVTIPGGFSFGSVTYTGLEAWDAADRALPAEMIWDDAQRTVSLFIPTDALESAELPLTVNPLFATGEP